MQKKGAYIRKRGASEAIGRLRAKVWHLRSNNRLNNVCEASVCAKKNWRG